MSETPPTCATYREWWQAQFPCPCGHSPDRHYRAPQDGICTACADCHGSGGALMRYASALVEAASKREAEDD
jgi:cytochrome c553